MNAIDANLPSPARRPFWREPMVWLVFGVPLASIVAGVGLVIVAVRAGGADAVTDRVQRMAQVQTTDLGADARAAQLRLSAVAQVRADRIDLVPVTGGFAAGDALVLAAAHPTDAARDLRLRLVRTENGWSAPQGLDTTHDWNLQLSPEDGAWRLRGRLRKDTRAVRLAPAQGGG